MQSFSKNLMIGLKAGRTCALIIEPLPLPLGIKRPTPSLVIMIDRINVDATS
jgi:hypothetical protein